MFPVMLAGAIMGPGRAGTRSLLKAVYAVRHATTVVQLPQLSRGCLHPPFPCLSLDIVPEINS